MGGDEIEIRKSEFVAKLLNSYIVDFAEFFILLIF